VPAIVIGVALLGFLYLWLCFLALVYVATPLCLVAAAGGVLAGGGTAVVLTVLTLAGRRPQVRVVGPAEVVAGAIGGQVRPGLPRRDRAWPTYFAVQMRHDLTAAIEWTIGTVSQLWQRAWSVVEAGTESDSMVLLFWPLLVPPLVLLLAVTAGSAAGVVLVAVVFALASAVAWTGGLLVVFALRAVDRAWQWLFRAAGSCGQPGCYEVSALPAYECPGCRELHRDIRPGRLGVLWRRCGCGHTMPTTVLRSGQLRAVCPRCISPLHEGAGMVTDVRVPVFGATMAGKTRFIMASLASLAGLAGCDGIAVSAPDDDSRQALAGYAEVIATGQSTLKTAPDLPAAVSLHLEMGRRKALVHVFDAAGELFVDEEETANLSYLDRARGLVFVLDPFSVPDVRARLAGSYAGLLDTAASHDPEDSYLVTVRRLRSYGVDTRRQRLAFVVSKGDLLLGLPVATGLAAGSAAVRPWLHEVGLDNLLLAADRDFAEVRFFLVSAMTAEPWTPTSALAPLRWLLAGDRIRLDRHGDS